VIKPGDKVVLRRPWGRTKDVEFAGLVFVKDRKAVRVAYRAQVHWPPCSGLHEIELERGRLMRTQTKPHDPPWFVDEHTLAEFVAMAEHEVAARREADRMRRR
jgi:hypothetical protein